MYRSKVWDDIKRRSDLDDILCVVSSKNLSKEKYNINLGFGYLLALLAEAVERILCQT